MHQIVCRLGLRPRPHWGSLQRCPDPLGVFRGPTSKERGKGRGRGEEGMVEEKMGEEGEVRPFPLEEKRKVDACW